MVTHSSILAWRIPWTEEPGGLQSIGSRRIRYNWSDLANTGWLSPALVISCYVKKTTPNLVSEHGKHSLAQFLWIRNLGTTWLGSSDSGSRIRFAGKGPLGLQASQGLKRIRFKQANSSAIGSSRLGSYNTVVVSLSTGLLAVQQVVSLKIKEVRQWQRKKARTQDISSSLFINLWNSTMSDVFCCMEVSHSSTHTQGEEKQSSL